MDLPSTEPRQRPPQSAGVSLGMAAVAFGLVGIFFLSFVFSPLAILCGLLAIFRLQIFSGLLAILFGIVGIITSPVLMGLVGLGAVVLIAA